ncbi:MAG: MoxR family ATPase [Candidatus Lokiarchaeota archaeon]|nr:MoxR family ATPase [Candidatus Lokiarchaeota archaeon]
MNNNENILRSKVWEILNTIQANQLYVHSSVMKFKINTQGMNVESIPILFQNDDFISKIRKYFKSNKLKIEETHLPEDTNDNMDASKQSKMLILELPQILTITILNALVPNSAMLLIGGHGGGKSTLVKHLGRMFTGLSMAATEECIIRAHPQLTEEKMIATLNIAKLLQSGEEEVLWRTFTTSFWKILDEVNRLSPYAQNMLLSMLAEGKVKYYDKIYPTDKYVMFATLNPGDVGTFEMSPPFLDRFSISVYISMPTTHDLSIILESKDDKLLGYDELVQVPGILTKEQLLSIWFLVDKVQVGKSAENFIHSIIREFTLCDRIDKGNSDYLTPETGLCTGCHFNLTKLVCNKVTSILSVRVAKDLLRYSKALSWLLGFSEVPIELIAPIAPYVISHRVKFVNRELNDKPYWGNKFKFTEDLVEKAKKRFVNREKCYEILDKFREGKGTEKDWEYLKGFESSDLITKLDLIPLVESLNNADYKRTVKLIQKYHNGQNLDKLVEINEMLQTNLTFPNRGELINMIGNALKELTYWAREFRFQYWDVVRYTISSNFIRFSKALEESTKKQSTIQLREADLFLQINVTGTTPNSLVQINCHGGRKALALKKLLEETYPKENYDVMLTTEEFISSFNQPVSSTPVSSSSEKNREESEQGDSEVDKLVDDILKNS